MATKVKDTNGCFVVPAFTGLGAPYWDQYARGAILGLTRGVNKFHIVRATLESLAFQANDVIAAMAADSKINLNALKVDGGASANNFLLQFQSDITGVPVQRPACLESTALGAAYLAGLSVKFWKNTREISNNSKLDRIFEPNMTQSERASLVAGWHKAVKCVMGWSK
jgi:glycerol kinase